MRKQFVQKMPMVRQRVGVVLPLIATQDYTVQTSGSTTLTHDYYNPHNGNLLLFGVHTMDAGGGYSNVSYGGVACELLVKDDSSWPAVAIYAVTESNQPAIGQTHTFSVTMGGSYAGATSMVKINHASDGIVGAIVGSNANSNVVTLNVTHDHAFMLSAIATRYNTGREMLNGQSLIFYEAYASPRHGGATYKDVAGAGNYDIGWAGGGTSSMRHVAVAVPLLLS